MIKKIRIKKLIPSTFIVFFLAFHASAISSQAFDPALLQNLTPEQLETVKNELNQKNIIGNEQPPVIQESTVKKEINETNLKDDTLKKYGYDFFTSAPTSVTAVGDLPLPADYKISILDQFTVILSGSKQQIFDLNVQLDGTILFPELGSISVVGETFGEIKRKLRNLVEQSYIGVNLDLSLKNLAAKKITIVGAIEAPGTYLVNPFSTISSALTYSGGILEIGSLRNIKLIRSNGQEFYFDLYKLLIDGDRTEDITIQAGDVILVNPAKQFIELEGEINRPAIYEIKEDDTLKDLVKFGAGFTNIANKKNIDYKILDIESSSIKLLNNQDINSSLTNIISVKVNPYNSKNITSIVVSGAFKEPGYYELSENETFQDFIKRLEFIDVYPWLAVLEQFDDKNYERKSILINLNDKDTYDSIKMIPNSKLFFFNIYEIESFKKYILDEPDIEEPDSKKHNLELSEISKTLINEYSLRINHQGSIYILPVYGRFKIKSFVDLLGLDMSNVENLVSYVSPISNISYNDDYINLNLVANKFHTVTFRASSNDLIDITIEGAIDFPGKYTLQSNSNISDLYELIGQFKDQAFYDGIILLRESVKERQIRAIEQSKNELNNLLIMQDGNDQSQADINSLDQLAQSINPENLGRISGNFSPLSKNISNTVLRDGDSIFVPLKVNTISVVGEVLNQTTFEITGKIKTSAAIDKAGGFNDLANKRKVYIIKANGLTVKANPFLVGNANLEPGDTLVVPRKIQNENPIIKALQPITQVISNIAFSAAALESLSNSN